MEQDAKNGDRKTANRSRHGCTNCRRSKVKCDEQKPSCTRCWQKNLQCMHRLELKWESNFRDRGVAFGRSGLWSKSPRETRQNRRGSPESKSPFPTDATWVALSTVNSGTFVNADIALFHQLYAEQQSQAEPHPLPAFDVRIAVGEQEPHGPIPSLPSSRDLLCRLIERPAPWLPSLRPSLSLFTSLDEPMNRVLLDYYINQICPRTTHGSQSRSPFASLLLPYSVSAAPAVLRAIQALAACHWSQYEPHYRPIALQLKSRVLKDLQRQINADHRVVTAEDPEVLVIVMFMCLFDIVDSCDQQWIVHLRGAKDIIRLRRRQEQSPMRVKTHAPQNPVAAFVELFFAFQDVMGRTACAKADLFGSSYWPDDDTTVNPWMGCSPALVSILFSVMDLSRSRRGMVSDEDQVKFNIRAATLNNRLRALKQDPATDEEDYRLRRIAELKKLTCGVYLRCALYGGQPSEPVTRSNVRMMLREINELLALGSACHLIWPLFVAAVEQDPLDDECWIDTGTGLGTDGRRFVLDLLARVAKTSVSSVSRTRMVIEQVWKCRDFDLSRSSGAHLPSTYDLNDWERYVVPWSDALSLV